ncbi:unnamed protein product [Rhizophagus irregularis]|uniref:Uncharacterized protein n=1 Tax=Rhizophagus irregularis TaxID=588596 RepID=A0A915YR14_9GLOM|nr:unnamed protein product [Rhizophagus irregularis]
MQSEIDSLKEINSKLLAEISELRKENAEVKAENIEVKVENAKLKHALEEHEARFTNLEQRDKEKTNLIAKLDDDIREIKQEQNVNILAQSNTFIPKSPIHSISSQSSISPNIEGISKQSDCSDHSIEKNNADPISQDFDSIPLDQTNISSVVDQYDTTESKSLEDDRETDSFLDEVHRKKVSNEIRERKRKIKLQHELTTQVSSSVTSVSSCPPTSSCSGKNVEKLCLKERDKQNTPSHQKILYREKVERGHNDEEIEDFGVGEKYKKETGCEPWQLSEDRLLINSKPENKVSYLTSPEQCEEKGPITFEARPDPKLIINRGAHHFPYDPELANIGQKQIMTVQIPRIVQLIKSWKALC